ncbi:hypothetical protein G3T14_18755 [Methylobacterium sp. BTF04]|uniref:TniQ family protein n=1 Tax=Methylobacterium sp. BTF04 TaxID=2708300 RepID=UPI0013D2D9E4|nr:hypothetical protein [Methylobacterium sp. BTF04]NEU14154.1 hypothetical protein [Methylobacterium sp. BTF04]
MFRADPPPIPGESLLGLIARTAARNLYPSLLTLIRLAEVEGGVASSVTSTLTLGEAERLAYVLKVPAEAVVSRVHPVVAMPEREGEFIDFYGVSLRSQYRQKQYRRVSPLALRLSAHHRSVHDLATFSFCPETWETLIDRCPVCDLQLEWFATRGVCYCDRCLDEDDNPTTDLRDHPQPKVEVEDEAALRFLTDLVNPSVDLREKALRNVDPALSSFAAGDLFEIAIVLGRCLTTPSDYHPVSIMPMRGPKDCEFLTPRLLSVLGRTLMEWQEGIGKLCETARLKASERPVLLGMFKEIGHLRNASWERSLSPDARRAVREAIAEDMRRTADDQAPNLRKRAFRHRGDLIDTMEAARILGVKHALMPRLAAKGAVMALRHAGADRALTLYDRAEIEAVAEVKRDMTEATKVARAVGLPVEALETLAEAGLILRADGPALLLGSHTLYYRQSSVDGLTQAIFGNTVPPRPGSRMRPMFSVLNQLPPGDKPWLDIVLALLSGELETSTDGNPHITRLFVDESQLRSLVASQGSENDTAGDDDIALAYREVAPLIGMPAPNVTWLVAAGLLGEGATGKRCITKRHVRDFNDTYASTAEVARALKISSRAVKPHLASKGILPAAALHNGNRFVWRRSEALGG